MVNVYVAVQGETTGLLTETEEVDGNRRSSLSGRGDSNVSVCVICADDCVCRRLCVQTK